MLLLLTPCIGMCGLFAFGKIAGRGIVKERKAEGALIAASLEDALARTGQLPDASVNPDHFSFETYPDAGYQLYFAEPGIGAPSDFFWVWSRGSKSWSFLEAGEFMGR